MEFPFNINNLFAEEISLIDRSLTPCKFTYETSRQRKDELRRVIDVMGHASAQAQNLHGPITSASKLAQSSHHLYIKKDATANNGNGMIVGFLKVGKKKLFIYDANGVQHEMEPLCVLDFYVCESCQRQGSGKRLFDSMLKQNYIDPAELAIDRPSSKFLSFLSRHYDLRSVIPQVNNFVVFQGFFSERRGQVKKDERNNSLDAKNLCYRDGQEVVDEQRKIRSEQWLDTKADMRGCIDEGLNHSGLQPGNGGQLSTILPSGASRPSSGIPQNHQSVLGMVAHQAMYSRHQVASPLAIDEINSAAKKPTNTAETTQNHNRAASPPLLSRNGPSAEYLRMTSNSGYLGRRGHLRVGDINQSLPESQNVYDPSKIRTLHQHQQDTAFNIFGIPKLPRRAVNANPMPYRKTALW